MGAWGFYDDENDDSIMEFMQIVDQEIYDAINPPKDMSYEELTEKIRQYILQNKLRTEKIFMKHINRIRSDTNDEYRHKTVIGILLMLAKMMANVKMQNQPLYGIPPASNMDFILVPNFPDKLKETAIECLNITIAEWNSEPENDMRTKRLTALAQELYLFSEGKLGKKGTVIQNNFQSFGFC